MKETNDYLASFIYEVGILSTFKRSGLDFLGSGNQNIASHSFRTAIIGYALATYAKGADPVKTLLLCLFHDIPESRTGDINYFQNKYVQKDESKAVKDIFSNLDKLAHIEGYIQEFNVGTSNEALLAQDADVLELIFSLREEEDKGNPQAPLWIEGALKRLQTVEAKELAHKTLAQKYYDWWHRNF